MTAVPDRSLFVDAEAAAQDVTAQERPHLFPPKRRRVVRMRSSLPPSKRPKAAPMRRISGVTEAQQDDDNKRARKRGASLQEGAPKVRRTIDRASSSQRAAQKAPQHVTGTVSVGTFEPMLEHSNGSLASMVDEFNAAVDEVNAASRDERLHSYNCLPDAPGQSIDWSRDDVDIRDEWFMPASVDDVVDNGRARTTLDRWLALWVRRPMILPRVCVALVRGPPGTGKTSSVRLALHKHGFNNIVEINASEVRSRALVTNRLKPLLLNSSVHGGFRRTAIVLEEVDGLYVGGAKDARGRKAKTGAASSAAPKETTRLSNDATAAAMASAVATNAFASADSSSSSSSGADALVKFLRSDGYIPKNADRRGLAAATAAAVDNEKFQRFRSTVPIIMLANESHAPYMKTLANLSLDLRFYPLRIEYMRKRLVNQLSVRLNIRWTRISNRVGLVDGPLYDTLIERSSGDMRKAVALMADAVRAAYGRRKELPADHKARQSNLLVLRYEDCQALLGKAHEDVVDSVPTLWGAARFLLCQLRCRCPPEQCCCAKRGQVPRVHQTQADVAAASATVAGADSTNYVGRRPITALEQVQRVVEHDIRGLADMLFENYPRCVAEPRDFGDVECRLAALSARRSVAEAFSDAEVLRSVPRFLGQGAVKLAYEQSGVVAPTMLIRYPQKYADLPERSVKRPECIETTRRDKQINLQKSAVDGENGNTSGALAKSIRERNAYVQQFGLPYQVDLSRWFYSDNYVSKMTETRKQTQMLEHASRALLASVGPHGAAGTSRLVGTALTVEQEEPMPQVEQVLMSQQERTLLRAQMQRVNAATSQCK